LSGPIILAALIALGAALAWGFRARYADASRAKRVGMWSLAGVDLLGLAAMALFWRPAEDVPDGGQVTEAIDAEVDPLDLVLPAQGPEPELRLRELAGKTAFFFVDNMESHKEGTSLRRAVNRWTLPEDVTGYYIGDAPQLPALMLPTIEKKFLGFMRQESLWPIYVDTRGIFVETFKLPRGHMGFLLLGPDGEIKMRHSGDLDEAKLDEIRLALAAEEPPEPEPAPEFSEAGFDRARCADKPCVFAFLDQKISRKDIPRIEGGFEHEESAKVWEQGLKPGVRLAGMATGDWKISGEKAQGLLVGELEGLEAEGWERVDAAPSLREAFGLKADDAALIVVDKKGRVAFKQVGLVRFWQLGQAGELLGLEARDMEGPDE
jgi:hypothetical protein